MSVTPIESRRRRVRGAGRHGTTTAAPLPGTPEYLEAQAARWPEHAVELLAEAARLRAATADQAA